VCPIPHLVVISARAPLPCLEIQNIENSPLNASQWRIAKRIHDCLAVMTNEGWNSFTGIVGTKTGPQRGGSSPYLPISKAQPLPNCRQTSTDNTTGTSLLVSTMPAYMAVFYTQSDKLIYTRSEKCFLWRTGIMESRSYDEVFRSWSQSRG
jgi:hypothetical protein